MNLDCGLCGLVLPGTEDGALVHDGQELPCSLCHAVNVVSCDEETDPYVGHWTCAHGVSSEDPCEACDDDELRDWRADDGVDEPGGAWICECGADCAEACVCEIDAYEDVRDAMGGEA